jgi:hypothetical protein
MIKIKFDSKNFLKKITADVANASEKDFKKRMSELNTQLALATPVDTGAAAQSWKVTGSAITSDCEYMDILNAGSSKQAPAFFIEKTLLSNSDVKPNGIIVKDKI